MNIARELLKIVLLIPLILTWTGIAVADNSNCSLIFAFDQVRDAASWQAVNDDVMGGRSSGGASYADGRLLFTGNINTNGGGFSSVRTALPPGILEGMGRFKLRVLQDTRHYQLIVQTDASFGGRPVAYRADIKNRVPGNWSEENVMFSELHPTVFGRPLTGPVFDASRARLLGIIIADAQDGAFHLEIETIHACPL